MTFKAILEGTLRRDAESWVRQLMTDAGYRIRRIEAESILFVGKNIQAGVSVEIWYGEFDQAGVSVIYNMDADGIARSGIWDQVTRKCIWFENNPYRHRENAGIDRFRLTRREM